MSVCCKSSCAHWKKRKIMFQIKHSMNISDSLKSAGFANSLRIHFCLIFTRKKLLKDYYANTLFCMLPWPVLVIACFLPLLTFNPGFNHTSKNCIDVIQNIIFSVCPSSVSTMSAVNLPSLSSPYDTP